MIKAILFDLDGVLIDSETFDFNISKSFILDNGYKSDPEVFKIWIGGGSGKDWWTEEILPRLNPEDDLVKFKEDFFKDHHEKRAKMPFKDIIFPDAFDTLKALKEAGYKLALCSSSTPEYIFKAVDDTNTRGFFDLIVSGHDFNKGKPFPDVYLFAKDKFEVTAEQCLVVEDSYNGILAGKNANMKVVAKKDYHLGLDQSKADYYIDNLEELLSLAKDL